jgi:hypothetical protein
MAMIGGSVTVNDDETESGTGLALALYLALKTAHAADLPQLSVLGAPPYTTLPADKRPAAEQSIKDARLKQLRGYAVDATALGTATVTYLQAHAEVSLASVVATVSTSASVGVLPTVIAAGQPIGPPGADVGLPVTGAGGGTTLGLT